MQHAVMNNEKHRELAIRGHAGESVVTHSDHVTENLTQFSLTSIYSSLVSSVALSGFRRHAILMQFYCVTVCHVFSYVKV